MSLQYSPQYVELCKSMNSYAAVLQMAKNARSICKSLDNRITTSSALDYAAQGLLPNPKDFPDHRLDRVKDYLKCVDDLEIRSAVIRSYEESLKHDNLVYVYQTISDVPRMARIRVIMNILWDNRPHKDR